MGVGRPPLVELVTGEGFQPALDAIVALTGYDRADVEASLREGALRVALARRIMVVHGPREVRRLENRIAMDIERARGCKPRQRPCFTVVRLELPDDDVTALDAIKREDESRQACILRLIGEAHAAKGQVEAEAHSRVGPGDRVR